MKTPAREILRMALRSMRKNPLRTFLLWLTTAIAIASIVGVVSVVGGGTSAFRRDMSKLGIDIITFSSAGLDTGPTALSPDVYKDVKSHFADTGAAFSLARMDWRPIHASAGEAGASCPVMEVEENFFDLFGLRLIAGRNFDAAADTRAGAPLVCIIDRERARLLFGDSDAVGKEITIDYAFRSVAAKVIGVIEDPMTMRRHIDQYDAGGLARMMATQHLTFKNIYVFQGNFKPAFAFSHILGRLTMMFVKPRAASEIDQMHERISAYLNKRNVAFNSFTMNRWLDSIKVTTARIEENSNMIWVIILLVASILIGTMNYLAVREKFREIAIRRVEGASRRAIMAQMAAESLLVSLFAGVGGIIIGVGMAHVLCAWVVEWPPAFTVWEVAMSMALALLVGAVATVLPALRAAQVAPAATLRYE